MVFKFAKAPELVVTSGTAVEPAYLRRGNAKGKDKGVAGRVAEKSLAKRLGGSVTPGSGASNRTSRTTPGSGSRADAKGDILLDIGDLKLLLENKTSTNDSFSVKKQHLYKIYQEALEVSKVPALSFQFVNSEGKSDKRDRWVCLPESFLMEYLG